MPIPDVAVELCRGGQVYCGAPDALSGVPGLADALGRDWRWLRAPLLIERIWIRRGCCRACRRSHALLPDLVLTRRLDEVAVIGRGMTLKVAVTVGLRPMEVRVEPGDGTWRGSLPSLLLVRYSLALATLAALALIGCDSGWTGRIIVRNDTPRAVRVSVSGGISGGRITPPPEARLDPAAEVVQNWSFAYIDQLPRTVRAYDAKTNKLVFCENYAWLQHPPNDQETFEISITADHIHC